MPEQKIETVIGEVLTGDAQHNALAFVAHLRANEMLFERGKGYWEDKLYWLVEHNGAYVCFFLINGSADSAEPEGWTVWLDDNNSTCFADFPLDADMKDIAWKHVDICGKCGGCGKPGGTRKTMFGKAFDAVCVTPMKFVNPDAAALACMKELVLWRMQ